MTRGQKLKPQKLPQVKLRIEKGPNYLERTNPVLVRRCVHSLLSAGKTMRIMQRLEKEGKKEG